MQTKTILWKLTLGGLKDAKVFKEIDDDFEVMQHAKRGSDSVLL